MITVQHTLAELYSKGSHKYFTITIYLYSVDDGATRLIWRDIDDTFASEMFKKLSSGDLSKLNLKSGEPLKESEYINEFALWAKQEAYAMLTTNIIRRTYFASNGKML